MKLNHDIDDTGERNVLRASLVILAVAIGYGLLGWLAGLAQRALGG